ncbi:MAG: hypothetical protein V2I33_21775 [Kangiellaceae bacterium]|nr:hypothetical protein [Kangiellaceae bacterium]
MFKKIRRNGRCATITGGLLSEYAAVHPYPDLISGCDFCLSFLVVDGRQAAITPSVTKRRQASGLSSD